MERFDLPLLIHGEDPHPVVPLYNREQKFVRTAFPALRFGYPKLRIVLEHLSTEEAVKAVRESYVDDGLTAGTITPHHLFLTFNDVVGNHDNYCLPIAKSEKDRLALIAALGEPCFFAGSDSAPHSCDTKKCTPAPAGIWSAPFALELYATIFVGNCIEDKLEDFTSRFGAEFFRLPLNEGTTTLHPRPPDNILPLGPPKVLVSPFLPVVPNFSIA